MAYTPFSQIGQPEQFGPEAPPETPQTWSSVANEYDQPYIPPTPTAPQLGTYQVQPAPTETTDSGFWNRLTQGISNIDQYINPLASTREGSPGAALESARSYIQGYTPPETIAGYPTSRLLSAAELASMGVAGVGNLSEAYGAVSPAIASLIGGAAAPMALEQVLPEQTPYREQIIGGSSLLGAVAAPFAYGAVRGAMRPTEIPIGAAEEATGAAGAPQERIPIWQRYGGDVPIPESTWERPGEVQHFRGERPPMAEPQPQGTTVPAFTRREYHAETEPGYNLAALQERERTSAPEGIYEKPYQDRAKTYFYRKGMNVPEGIQEAAYQVAGLEKPSDVAGASVYRQYTTPATKMSDDVYRAVNARANASADVSSNIASSQYEIMDRIRQLFGNDYNRPNIEYVGPETRNQSFLENNKPVIRSVPANEFGKSSDGKPLTGSLLDMMQHPDYYNLTPEQRSFFKTVLDPRNEQVTREINALYGTDIGTFKADPRNYIPGSEPAFMPNINANEDIPEYITSRQAATKAGRVYDTAAQRVANDPDFVPEIDIQRLLNKLDSAKANAAGTETMRALLGVSDKKLPGLSPVEGLNGYLPHDEAAQVSKFLRTENPNSNWAKAVKVASAIDQTVLGGTMEMLGTHGVPGAFAHPFITTKSILGSMINAAQEGDVLYPFRNSSMATDFGKDPSWQEFFAYSGRNPKSITNPGEEYSGGLLSRFLPKKVTDAAYNIITRQQKAIYDVLSDGLIKEGKPENQAKAAAAWEASHIVPMFNPSREGLSRAGAQLQGAGLTSISTTRMFQEHLGAGVRGLIKMGTLQPTSLTERLAAQSLVSFLTTLITGSAVTAFADAEIRGTDRKKAVEDAVTPGSGKWGHWFVPGTGFHSPMGSSYRSLIEAVAPKIQTIDGRQTQIPLTGLFNGDLYKAAPVEYAKGVALAELGGLGKYGESRVAPWAQYAKGLVTGKDYYGRKIFPGDFIGNILAGLAYTVRSTSPIAAQTPAEALQRGHTAARAAVETPFSFFGLHMTGPTQYEDLDTAAYKSTGKHWDELSPGEQARLKNQPGIVHLADEYNIERAQRDPQYAASKEFTDNARSQINTIQEYVKAGKNELGSPFTVKDARTRISDIVDTLAAQKEGVYANSQTKPGKDPVLDEYYKAIQAATDKSGKLDQNALAAWHEQNDNRLTPSGQTWNDYIFENAGTALRGVPLYDNLRDAKREIEKSGYWKIQDQTAQEFGKLIGIQAKDRTDLEQKVKQYAIQVAGVQNAPLAEARIMNSYRQMNSAKETDFLQRNKYIGAVLKAWGYSEPLRAQITIP